MSRHVGLDHHGGRDASVTNQPPRTQQAAFGRLFHWCVSTRVPMDDTANNLAENVELAQSDAPEAQPTEQPETDQRDDAPT